METPATRAAPRLKFTRAVARIDEEECIGCALCLAACPVDAIIGAAQWLHAVIEEQCIGCELCPPVCPVDCIAMAPNPAAHETSQTPEAPEEARQRRMRDAARRVKARKRRLAREEERRKNARDAARKTLQRRVAKAARGTRTS